MGFLDPLIGAVTGFLAQIGAVIQFLFNLVVGVAQFLFTGELIIANYTVGGFSVAGDFFHHLWGGFFKNIFSGLLTGIVNIVRWLETHLRPILDFLKKVRGYIDRIYNQYILRFIVMLQRVRSFLAILRLLHIKWAQQLDGILAQVQRDVQGAFLLLRGVLNTAIDLLNILADPTKLLRRPTLILSLRRGIYALIRQVTHLPPGYLIGSRRKTPSPGQSRPKAGFNWRDVADNPPPSFYLGFEYGVKPFDFLQPGDVIGDDSVDDLDNLDFFDDDLLSSVECKDPQECLLEAIKLLTARS